MNKTFAWVCLGAAILSNGGANILIKKSSTGAYADQLSIYYSPIFIAGIILFGANLLFYAQALRSIPLSSAYPALVGGSLLIVNCISVLYFGEMPSIRQVFGMLLVAVGIWFIAYV
ncbi:multidrug efflux SMR transporter [Polynucleobacter sp. Tro8-14-1]|uniref:DMT family transporter n=1 Tax=Polynucleobacter sp. Tro8-14-1 TaxID=1758383 RepID=UPI001C0B40FD|nr:SMR family transporter [Polynucleobacter sp. Tro8-14-1]MBU3563633.1 hypothetical protein [Polynucleobacter sp. Tro8-14-1]